MRRRKRGQLASFQQVAIGESPFPGPANLRMLWPIDLRSFGYAKRIGLVSIAYICIALRLSELTSSSKNVNGHAYKQAPPLPPLRHLLLPPLLPCCSCLTLTPLRYIYPDNGSFSLKCFFCTLFWTSQICNQIFIHAWNDLVPAFFKRYRQQKNC
jgi:hypothetical protein